MTEKELRKLNRYQLLELLVMQTSRADKLQAQLDEARRELESRKIRMRSLGTIAEAAVEIGGMMNAAQATADLFLDSAQAMAKEIEESAASEAAKIVENARREAEWILEAARRKVDRMKKEDD